MVLQDIATAEGDTRAYIAQYSPDDMSRPMIAAEIAHLMLTEGQAQGALVVLEAAHLPASQRETWDEAYIACLIALDRLDDAQTHRWQRFCETLNGDFLRPYLKSLPDFEDIEAEDRARAHALQFGDAMTALAFLLNWPDHATASALILNRIDELDGNQFEILTPAAEILRDRFPLAAVLLWRAMINFALHHGRATRYSHAADHLNDCELLDAEIADYAQYPTHHDYIKSLENRHERKTSFWNRISAGQ
jgi:hypothetical protein